MVGLYNSPYALVGGCKPKGFNHEGHEVTQRRSKSSIFEKEPEAFKVSFVLLRVLCGELFFLSRSSVQGELHNVLCWSRLPGCEKALTLPGLCGRQGRARPGSAAHPAAAWIRLPASARAPAAGCCR